MFELRKRKIYITVLLVILSIVLFSVVGLLRKIYYKNNFLEYLNDELEDVDYYAGKVEVRDFYEIEREFIIYLDSDFDGLDEKERQQIVEKNYAKTVSRCMSNWMVKEGRNSGLRFTYSYRYSARLILKTDMNEYKHGAYEQQTYGVDFVAKYWDRDGRVHDYYAADRIEQELAREKEKEDKKKNIYDNVYVGMGSDNIPYTYSRKEGGYVGSWNHRDNYAYRYIWEDKEGNIYLEIHVYNGVVDYYWKDGKKYQ